MCVYRRCFIAQSFVTETLSSVACSVFFFISSRLVFAVRIVKGTKDRLAREFRSELNTTKCLFRPGWTEGNTRMKGVQ